MSSRAVQHFLVNEGENTVRQAKSLIAISSFEQRRCLNTLPRYLHALKGHGAEYLGQLLSRDRYDLQKPYDLDEPLPEDIKIQDRVLEVLQYL
ncbi:hypothetical protein BX616_002781, partial [Lobosporangium transversale]